MLKTELIILVFPQILSSNFSKPKEASISNYCYALHLRETYMANHRYIETYAYSLSKYNELQLLSVFTVQEKYTDCCDRGIPFHP